MPFDRMGYLQGYTGKPFQTAKPIYDVKGLNKQYNSLVDGKPVTPVMNEHNKKLMTQAKPVATPQPSNVPTASSTAWGLNLKEK